ncbi:MAG: hypothetical protein KAI72_01440, partial [Candidatus Pacebacteria bacterium]|nr:hypothetical protein [Candidatus Paceibacterota bacterium]
KVVINKANNTFIHDSINGHKFGNSDGSYRMLATPFYLVNKQNPSPMEYLSKLLTGVLFIVVGDTAEATQIEDGNGNQYYKADPDNPDQTIIEEEPDLRIPDFSGIPVSDYSDGNEPVAHLYYGEGENRSFKYDLRLRANIPDGTEFEWCMDSGTFGAKLIGEGSREFPCRIKVDETKSTPSITYTASEALESNLATITLAAGNKEQWIEFRDMKLIKGQSIKATVKRAGKEAVFETDGPDITGTIVVKNGKESEEIVVGEVTVKSGESTRIEAEAPKVHHYLSETNYGENDWLIAPVKIELIAEDFSQTGIKLIEYSLDKSVWNTYEEPFIFDINGESTIFYRAMDNSYHKSQIRSIELKIDMVPPQVEVSFSQFSYTRVETASLSYSVIDPSPGSGISNYTALYNNQEVKSGYTIDLFWQPLGTYTLTVTAIDNAGHKTTKTAQYALKADLSGFAQTVDQLYSMNEITQKNMYMFLKNHALN